MSGYAIKTIYHTIQGEGAQQGRAAVFCRFSGCNLWTGREADRTKAICKFCDTDITGIDGPRGGHYKTAAELAEVIRAAWPADITGTAQPFVVCTGGEPLLQLDDELVEELHEIGFEVAVETNGTRRAPAGIDWVCVSPKAGADLVIDTGDELKLVFPQVGAEPEKYVELDFDHFFLQPMDGPDQQRNTAMVLDYCLRHPQWRVGLQLHKLLGVA
ncbi:MAG: 7-carboxy-7-deazaguanine synthase [Candidatus Sumerlaeota bacterium]|nr:7-carboxy-7-deazaguanine synthase [Candidatus Sumerlaeota bacterium]